MASPPVGVAALALLDNLPALWVALTADEQKTLYRLIFCVIEVCDQAIVAIEARGPFHPRFSGAGSHEPSAVRLKLQAQNPAAGSERAGCLKNELGRALSSFAT